MRHQNVGKVAAVVPTARIGDGGRDDRRYLLAALPLLVAILFTTPASAAEPAAPTTPAAAQPTTAEGVALRDALLREAEHAGKDSWRPMLRYLAELHGRSVLPPVAYFKYPYETMGPGYQNGRVFGHIDLTHERLDTIRALPEHVRNQTRNELAGQQPDGLIPGIVLFKDGKASWKNFKAFPPIWVFAVDAYVERTGDTALLRECLEPLKRQIGWFEAKRAVPGGGFYYLDEIENTWESGMDAGIRWDVRPKAPAAAIDASSQVYALYDHAARWSRQLGEPADAWAKKAAELREFINRELWDPQTGFYYDAWVVHDRANRHLAFEGMWPLVVGAATPEQAQRVVDEHLLNPKEFFTPCPMATVAASDPKFELRMWRGPPWNSMTYWAARGCANYGRSDAAHRILQAALDATALQFQRTGTIWEYQHPFLGDETSLRRKPNMPGMPDMPHRDYVGHNPLFAMAALWRETAPSQATR